MVVMNFLKKHWKKIFAAGICTGLLLCTATVLIVLFVPLPIENAYLEPEMPPRPIVSDDKFAALNNTEGVRTLVPAVDLTSERMNNPFWSVVGAGGRVCFIGDSITAGSRNGNYPWFEAMERLIPGDVSYYGRGSATALWMSGQTGRLPRADVYVIALGCNDIYFQIDGFCAITPEDYTDCLQLLRNRLLKKSPGAEFVFIAPWPVYYLGETAMDDYTDEDSLYARYSGALKSMCQDNGDTYINANFAILRALLDGNSEDYMLDKAHPNGGLGIRLYCEAVLDYKAD